GDVCDINDSVGGAKNIGKFQTFRKHPYCFLTRVFNSIFREGASEDPKVYLSRKALGYVSFVLFCQ
ncbi:MAG: hypothetical protein ACOYXT_11315, partial [Bacteroidota bacterium]